MVTTRRSTRRRGKAEEVEGILNGYHHDDEDRGETAPLKVGAKGTTTRREKVDGVTRGGERERGKRAASLSPTQARGRAKTSRKAQRARRLSSPSCEGRVVGDEQGSRPAGAERKAERSPCCTLGCCARVVLAPLAFAFLGLFLLLLLSSASFKIQYNGVGGRRPNEVSAEECPSPVDPNQEDHSNESKMVMLRDLLLEEAGSENVSKGAEDYFGLREGKMAVEVFSKNIESIVDSANTYVSKGLVALASGIAKPSFIALLEEEYRFFDSNNNQRRMAYKLFKSVETLPIISPYSQASSADIFFKNVSTGLEAFGSPTKIFVNSDKSVVRFLQSQKGLNASHLLREDATESEQRRLWQVLGEKFHLLLGTSSRMWIEQTLMSIFGIHDPLDGESAQHIYDLLVFKLNSTEYSPRRLSEHFNLEMLGMSFPASGRIDMMGNATVVSEGGEEVSVGGEIGVIEGVKPTFMPDKLFNLKDTEWKANVNMLGEGTSVKIDSYSNFLKALEIRRKQFKELGSVATFQETRVPKAELTALPEMEALFAAALSGRTSDKDLQIFQNHMLMEMARMSVEDGLVMQLHTGLERNYQRGQQTSKGGSKDAAEAPVEVDIPIAVDFSHGLQSLLNTYGNHPNLTLVLFTHDESTYSRELAPLAVQYQSINVGSPLWFHENPEGIRGFLDSVVGLCGISNLAGYIDNAHHFLQIPSRHKIWRKVVSDWVAKLVLEGRIQEKDAFDLAKQLAYTAVKRTYNV
ncbi:uronate isomerase [Chloropicon primus]|uniref:Uronate isomerase n=3 Tax=Chloropicon primus TaxID=1764295 RepID=A0A5B8ML26_9CHLO|nr:uronate isomerase [Chloropicon primus]UPQ99284.1 uronate isomerase [Chloropicon primus]|eukprot:QDZ20072.1 uronate isomerase [Chloropicon primus]